MDSAFIQIDENTWQTKKRGNTFTISRNRDTEYPWRKWTVIVENAATRAWRALGASNFETVEQIEAKYKSLRGIAAIVEE